MLCLYLSNLAQPAVPASIHDLIECIKAGSLGSLNPFPWALQSGNCLGWIAYAYYTGDPYMLAGNLPGFLFSLFLNIGAIKLQYANAKKDSLVFVQQEKQFFSVILFWVAVLIYVGWIGPASHAIATIGIIVNANLVIYYGSPLQALLKVIEEQSSDSIHVPTMILNWVTTSFWILFGIARNDWYILVPNILGLMLGLSQGVLCGIYPRREKEDADQEGVEAIERTRLTYGTES